MCSSLEYYNFPHDRMVQQIVLLQFASKLRRGMGLFLVYVTDRFVLY